MGADDDIVAFRFKSPVLYRPASEVFHSGVPLTFGLLAEFTLPREFEFGSEQYIFSMNRLKDTGIVLSLSVKQNLVTFTYTDPNGRPGYVSPKFSTKIPGGTWTTLLFIVTENTIAFYRDCNKKPSFKQELGRTMPPVRLRLDGNLYVGRRLPNRKKQQNMNQDPLLFRVGTLFVDVGGWNCPRLC